MQVPVSLPRDTGAWWRTLAIGLLLYAIGVGVLVLTGNPNLFPTVVLIGNFLVPIAYVAFFYQRRHLSALTMPTTAAAFFYGGVLGVFAASLLEPAFIRRLDFATVFVVALIEEAAKIIGVFVVARRRRHDQEIDGLILGAASGMGFAALESTGYAFTMFLLSGGSLSVAVITTLLRGILAPIGHGTWTAQLAAVLFREGRPKHFHLDFQVIGAYLVVVVLHGLWDGLPALLAAFAAPGVDIIVGQGLIAAIGLFILWRRWREAVRRSEAQRPAVQPLPAEHLRAA